MSLLSWTPDGLRAQKGVGSWSIRCRATPRRWVLDGVVPVRAGKRVQELEDRLRAGALARAEEAERRIAREGTYPAGFVVCVVDDLDLAICTRLTGQKLEVAAWLWPPGEGLLQVHPGLLAAGEEEAAEFVRTSPWFGGRSGRRNSRSG